MSTKFITDQFAFMCTCIIEVVFTRLKRLQRLLSRETDYLLITDYFHEKLIVHNRKDVL